MNRTSFVAALCAASLLAACEAKIGKEDAAAPTADADGAREEISAEGKAEEGQFSINAPGFDLKFDIPDGLAERAEVESDSDILYPGSSLSGLHIEAGERSDGRDRGAVELRFASADAPDKIAAWYRDPARAAVLTIASAGREGDDTVIRGTQKEDGDPFTVRLSPASGGGTDGRLVFSDAG
ncbi:hypothetical protein ACFQRC_06830 [Enterovirga sp. GCM10030262]|uniref:hypothetical protein n=1 Tax=Enterovirga sp. GCM10030262 TaxID=3273391 RepID=UPI00361FEF73